MKKWIVASVIIGLVIVSLTPTFYEWQSRGRIKPIRYFELVHNFPTDYNFYLSRIRQGKEGASLAVEKYTSEPHEASLLQVLYVLIGRVWDWSHGQTPYVWLAYHAMRVFFGALFLFVIWKLIDWFFSLSQLTTHNSQLKILTFLLAVTASTWPKFEMVDGWPRFGGFMPWYSLMDAMQRLTFLPHVLFGQALLVFILWVFMGGFISKKHPGNWVFLGIVGFIEGIVFPPGLLFIYVVLAVHTLIDWVHKNLYAKLIFLVLSVPSLIYYQLLLSEYPWRRLVEFDVLHPTQFSYVEYFLAVGPVLVLGLIAAVYALIGRSKRLAYLVSWVVAWLGLLFLFNFIPQQSPTRFTQMVPHIPLAILGSYFLYKIYKNYNRYKYYIVTIPVLVILFAFGSMFSSWLWQKDFIDHKLRADYPAVPHGAEVMYPLNDIIVPLTDFVQVFLPRNAVMLSGFTTGNSIPVYAGTFTYIGHANTVRSEIKEAAVSNFYRNRLGTREEMAWLTSQGISYVFYGPEEVDIAGGLAELNSLYPELIEIYHAYGVRIYKVPTTAEASP